MFDTGECFREVDRADVQRSTPLTTTLLQYSVHHEVIVTSMVGPETLPDLEVVFSAEKVRAGHTKLWQTACIELAGCKSACNYLHPLCHLFCR